MDIAIINKANIKAIVSSLNNMKEEVLQSKKDITLLSNSVGTLLAEMAELKQQLAIHKMNVTGTGPTAR